MVLLRALVCDRHIQNNWSEIQNIGTVQFIIDQHISTETKSRDLDKVYMKLPEDTDANLAGDEFVELFKVNLTSLRATAASCIASNEYKRAGTMTEEKQNVYQDGDLVLYDLRGPDKDFLPSKLTTPYKGPYIVSSQHKNDVTCKHANQGTVQVFHVDRVKPFYGSLEEAQKLSRVEYQ